VLQPTLPIVHFEAKQFSVKEFHFGSFSDRERIFFHFFLDFFQLCSENCILSVKSRVKSIFVKKTLFES